MTAARQARALREQAQRAVSEAHLAVAQALVACRRAYAAVASAYDLLASMQKNAAGSASAIVGEQRQPLGQQHRTDGDSCGQGARTLAHPAIRTQQTEPSGQAASVLDTSSPEWATRWPELEALAQELAIVRYAGRPGTAALLEQLSHREMEVLRYLPSVLTAGEIGAELCVSVNTVKAHLRSIYRKLGVSRRRDAVVRAYHYGILHGPFPPDQHPG